MVYDLADPRCDVDKILEEFAEHGAYIWPYQSGVDFGWTDLNNWIRRKVTKELESGTWFTDDEYREINTFTDKLIQLWLDIGLISHKQNKHLQYYYERKKHDS